jgi:hypothetical protein
MQDYWQTLKKPPGEGGLIFIYSFCDDFCEDVSSVCGWRFYGVFSSFRMA